MNLNKSALKKIWKWKRKKLQNNHKLQFWDSRKQLIYCEFFFLKFIV